MNLDREIQHIRDSLNYQGDVLAKHIIEDKTQIDALKKEFNDRIDKLTKEVETAKKEILDAMKPFITLWSNVGLIKKIGYVIVGAILYFVAFGKGIATILQWLKKIIH